MRRHDDQHESVEIVLFGMHCRLTANTLTALMRAGHTVRMVILPRYIDDSVQVMLPQATKPRIPVLQSDPRLAVMPNVATQSWSAGAALVETSRQQLGSLPRRFASLRKGLAVSACFPWKLPPVVIDAPPLGAINVHPSLLPRHRGPDPLFWTFHAGDRETGVTIHRMTDQLDGGPIILQQRIDLPLETDYDATDRMTAHLGAKLIVRAIAGLTTETLPERDQPSQGATYASHPSPSDLILTPGWPAERAFRFVRGVGASHGPLHVRLRDGSLLPVVDATAFHPDRTQDETVRRQGEMVTVQFRNGVVQFRSPV